LRLERGRLIPPAAICHNTSAPNPDGRLITDIDQRAGWPDELKILLKRFPRETWHSQGTVMTDFWLERHGYFRDQCRALRQMADEYRSDAVTPEEFGASVAPRLQAFLGMLHGHHQIEDFHYFPAFRELHRNLAPGFDVLANDHEVLHEGIVAIVTAANTLLKTIRDAGKPDAQRHASDRYIAASEIVYGRLLRHLDDEEDLIIPIMLEHGGG
jgi:hypothetical protein